MTQVSPDAFGAQSVLETAGGAVTIFRLKRLEELGLTDLGSLPYSVRVWLEGLLRLCNGREATEENVRDLARWGPASSSRSELPFVPARVLLQDFTGVPAVVDLAALRSAVGRLGGDPAVINPQIPVDLVIDHSVQVDAYGTEAAVHLNAEREFERNRERYEFLHWAQGALEGFRVVPPATGIVHQVNLEYLATVVSKRRGADGAWLAFPDTLVGTDSHTTMINSLGVVGWGVGGIEAEAAMLGEPITMLPPKVVGFELVGELPAGATATDLVLTVTQMLRQKGVVGKFVEFYGLGVTGLSLPDRATIANMAPEYGATMGYFPVDAVTLGFLRDTGRPAEAVDLVERYCKTQGLFREDAAPVPTYSDTLALDMAAVEPSLAGPKRPQDRIPLRSARTAFQASLRARADEGGFALDDGSASASVDLIRTGAEECSTLAHGAVVIAAITSCTNTSNPAVMMSAGLLAKNAVETGLRVPPWVKTSLAPGSTVVTRYLDAAGLTPYLDTLGFNLVGYGCTTCIGNSGPLPEHVSDAIEEGDLVAAAVLSGNRNFEGRISPHVRANYLASPPLVVAYALAGTVDFDMDSEPLGRGADGRDVHLRDIWPSAEEVADTVSAALEPAMFREQYGEVYTGNEIWNAIPKLQEGDLYAWDPESTYIKEPPFFFDVAGETRAPSDIHGARVLAFLGDSVTTDHISPAGSIASDSPAGRYLAEHGVASGDFNSYGSRRGNHEVMMRGTLANIRLKNFLVPGTEGSVTGYQPDGQVMSIYDAAMRYADNGTPLLIVAGKEYGTGSSRDWAAKGVNLLGVKAVIAESYERIHRSNLVGMGVLPLQFKAGEDAQRLGLSGDEAFGVSGIAAGLQPRQELEVSARREDGTEMAFQVVVRLDTPVEVEYYQHGGVLQTILLRLLANSTASNA